MSVDDAPSPASGDERRMQRLRAAAVDARGRADATFRRIEAMRPENRLVDALFGTFERESGAGGALFAGAIAFRFFMLLIPYVFVIVFGFGLGANASGTDPHELARSAGITGLAARAVLAGAGASPSVRWIGFLLALYGLFSGARNLLKALRIVHSIMWDVPLVRLKNSTRATFGLLGVVVIGSVMVEVVHRLKSISFGFWLLSMVAVSAIPAGIWLACSLTVFPRITAATWRDLLPGSVVFGLGVQGLHYVTVVYVAGSIASKSETYGAIGAALTILLWAYMLGRLVTGCVALNATLWEIDHRPAAEVSS